MIRQRRKERNGKGGRDEKRRVEIKEESGGNNGAEMKRRSGAGIKWSNVNDSETIDRNDDEFSTHRSDCASRVDPNSSRKMFVSDAKEKKGGEREKYFQSRWWGRSA